MADQVLSNARLVLAGEIVHGHVAIDGPVIGAIGGGVSMVPGTVDLDGDYLLPGLVELHTDNLENHVQPRPGVLWPILSAIMDHDARIAGAGITTVLDAIAIGAVRNNVVRDEAMASMVGGLTVARDQKMLRADHLLHLRAEISTPDVLEHFDRFADVDFLRLVSVMDHTPGQRQFVNLEKHYEYYKGKFGMSDEEIALYHVNKKAQQERWSAPNRTALVERCHERRLPLASHDDATREHVAEAVQDGIVIAEFPTTVDAAAASHGAGLKVLMGGPNVVRGLSHSGNVSARDLAAHGYLDIISSDYVPSSLLLSVFGLADADLGISLSQATAMASKTPAEAVGLDDRGEIAIGRRADLVQVRLVEGVPVVRGVWREGRRVA